MSPRPESSQSSPPATIARSSAWVGHAPASPRIRSRSRPCPTRHVFDPRCRWRAASSTSFPGGVLARAAGGRATDAVDIGTIVVATDGPSTASVRASGDDPNAPTNNLPPGSLTGAITRPRAGAARSSRRRSGAAGRRGRDGDGRQLCERGERDPATDADPVGTIADLDGPRCAPCWRLEAAAPAFASVASPYSTRSDGAVSSPASAAQPPSDTCPPDVGAPGAPSFDASPRRAVRGLRRDESMAAPHVAGAAALLLSGTTNWPPRTVKSAPQRGLRGPTRRAPRWRRSALGSGLVNPGGRHALRRHRPGLALLRRPCGGARRVGCSRSPRGRRRGDVDAAGSLRP